MGLQVFYSDPPQTDAEKKEAEDAKKNGQSVAEPVSMLEITNYIPSVEWSGDLDSAARKVAFKLAYNTAANDSTFQAVLLKLGGFIYVYYDGQQIFSGRIFYVKRNTADYTFDYVAYDDMIFLAKSQVYLKISDVTITDAIKQVCGEIGIPVADDIPTLDTKVNFIADGKSCTEVFQMLQKESMKQAAAKTSSGSTDDSSQTDTGEFAIYCKLDKVTLVKKGTLCTEDILSDSVQIEHTEHSQSIEDMINRVKSVDDVGTICRVYSIEDDMTHYGTLQKVYKMQNPKSNQGADNVAAAKAQLKRIKEESSLEGLGNINCITGFCVTVQEQQLQGKFYIKADRHKFAENTHTMNLTLEYIPDKPDTPTIKVENLAEPVFKSSGSKKSSTAAGSTGNIDMSQTAQNVDTGCEALDNAQGEYVPNGCVYRLTQAGSYWSPFLQQEYDKGVLGVGTLYEDANAAGLEVVPYDADQLEKGDTIVYREADDSDWAHVAAYDGEGGVWHNSSQEQSWYHQTGSVSMGSSEYPAYIIKTSKG